MSVAIEQTQLDTIQHFARSAEAFCSLMENQADFTDDAFVRHCASTLAALYADALELPDLDDDTCEPIGYPPVDGRQVYAGVRNRLQRLTVYSAYFDPYDQGSGMIHTLDDDLGDIYRDLRKGLEVYQQGTRCAIVEAVFDWKFLFSSHWGHHLVSALTALHQIIAENLRTNDERTD